MRLKRMRKILALMKTVLMEMMDPRVKMDLATRGQMMTMMMMSLVPMMIVMLRKRRRRKRRRTRVLRSRNYPLILI
jgi:hypothetical protein